MVRFRAPHPLTDIPKPLSIQPSPLRVSFSSGPWLTPGPFCQRGCSLFASARVSYCRVSSRSFEELWFVVAWLLGIRPFMRVVYAAYQSLLLRLQTGANGRPRDFLESSLARFTTPLYQLGFVFAVLWVFDNLKTLAPLLGVTVNESSPFIRGFPNAAYTAHATLVALYFQNEFFRSLRIEAGARNMIQRFLGLITVIGGGGLVTSMLGLDPKALLAFGGMAGLCAPARATLSCCSEWSAVAGEGKTLHKGTEFHAWCSVLPLYDR